MNITERLLFLNESDVLKLLTPADAIAAAEDTFYHIGTGEITVGQMALMYADKEQKNNFHSMPAVLHHRNFAGVKWIDTYANPLPGYPFSHGNLVVLSDVSTGSPIAIVGATHITTMRTAGAMAWYRQNIWRIPTLRYCRYLAAGRRPGPECGDFWKGSPLCGRSVCSAAAVSPWKRRGRSWRTGWKWFYVIRRKTLWRAVSSF